MLSKSVRLAGGQRVRLPSGLSLLVSLLVGHCVPLLAGHRVRLVSLLFPFVSLLVSLVVPLLVGRCVRLVFPLSFTCASSLPLSLATRHICLPAALLCNPLHLSPSSGLRVACNRLQLSPVSASALQSLILHLSPSSDCCVHLCLAILYLSPSSGLHVASNPLHLSPRVYICLPALDSALQSFVSQLWRSQALVAECSDFEKHKLFGVYGGVILFALQISCHFPSSFFLSLQHFSLIHV